MDVVQIEALEYCVASSFRELTEKTSVLYALRTANALLRDPVIAEVILRMSKQEGVA